MTKQEKPQCSGTIWRGAWGHVRCEKAGRLEHDGKHYCGTHHPPTKAAKDEERHRKWSERAAKERAMREKAMQYADEQARRAECYYDLLWTLVALVAECEADRWPKTAEQMIALAVARAAIAKSQGEKK